MATITLKDVPDRLKERIQERADREGRSLNQQSTSLLKRSVRENPTGFERTYQSFRERKGDSPLERRPLNNLRSQEVGRQVDL